MSAWAILGLVILIIILVIILASAIIIHGLEEREINFTLPVGALTVTANKAAHTFVSIDGANFFDISGTSTEKYFAFIATSTTAGSAQSMYFMSCPVGQLYPTFPTAVGASTDPTWNASSLFQGAGIVALTNITFNGTTATNTTTNSTAPGAFLLANLAPSQPTAASS